MSFTILFREMVRFLSFKEKGGAWAFVLNDAQNYAFNEEQLIDPSLSASYVSLSIEVELAENDRDKIFHASKHFRYITVFKWFSLHVW